MIFNKTEHGGDIYDKEIQYDFSVNINPLGTPDSVRQAIIDSAKDICNYPDPCCRELKRVIAEYEGVPDSCVLCGNGAAELIYSFCAALRPDTALELAPTFSEYSKAAEIAGCNVERFFLSEKDNFILKEDFLTLIKSKHYDIIFLCNPNNPTGCLIEPALLEEILRVCAQKNTKLFLDECFLELSDDGGINSMKKNLLKYPNLFILKAFTKNFGMAGLRLGYCLCSDKNLLETMAKTTQVWNVSTPAQKAGCAALKEKDFLSKAKTIIFQERVMLAEELKKLGLWVCESKANYILFYSQKKIDDSLLDKGILIRDCSNYCGLGSGWYRIAVRLHDENVFLVRALQKIMGE